MYRYKYIVGIKSRIIYFKQHALILKWIIVITNGNGICNGMDFADFLFCTLLTGNIYKEIWRGSAIT